MSSFNDGKNAAKDEPSTEQQPYSEVEQHFLEYTDEYLRVFSATNFAPEIAFSQARLEYLHHDFEAAKKNLIAFVAKHSNHAAAPSAAFLIIDIYNRSSDYPSLIVACKNLLKNHNLTASADFKERISRVLRQTELKEVQLAEEKGQFENAARGYLHYAETYGPQDAALYEVALYNATQDFAKANLGSETTQAQEVFLQHFPKSKYAGDVLLRLGKTNESMGKLDKAAVYFWQFSDRFASHPQAQNALRLAAHYYWASGDTRTAERALQKCMVKYPNQADLAEQDLIEIYESENNVRNELALLEGKQKKGHLSSEQTVELSAKIIDLKMQHEKRIPVALLKKSLDYAKANAKALKQSHTAMDALARLEFIEIEGRYRQFQAIKISEKTLPKKLALLKKLDDEYGTLAKLGGEWGLAALYRGSEAYHRMAQDIAGAPVPPGLTTQQLEEYRAQLKKTMVLPLEQKAEKLGSLCVDKAGEFQLRTEWTSRCSQMLTELEPDKFPLRHSVYLPALFTASIQDKGAEEASWNYPYHSPLLFNLDGFSGDAANERLPGLGLRQSELLPQMGTYDALNPSRQEELQKQLAAKENGQMDFNTLSLMRMQDPARAIPEILHALETNAGNVPLLNLLGLAYLDLRAYAKAQTIWYSLLANGHKDSLILNNLGVAAYAQGREIKAVAYFNQAIALHQLGSEPAVNLAFIDLKYKNSREAEALLYPSLQTKEGETNGAAQAGWVAARLQQYADQGVAETVSNISDKYGDDPYVKLVSLYFLVDVQKDKEGAQKMLAEFLRKHPVQENSPFRRLEPQVVQSVAILDK